MSLAGRRAVLPRLPLVAAVLAALPSFFVPFLSDDWANLKTRAADLLGRTPYGDFRPVSQATFAVDRALWGTWPLPWHLTNILFVVAATALLTALVQRHLRDRALATLAGLLFALHPYHIASVAWISGRSEAVCAVFLFAAMLVYDRWRDAARGLPIAALLLYAAALLSTAAAVVLPIVLVAIGWARDRRPPGRRELLRGLLPLATLAALHLLWLRPWRIAPSDPGMPGWFGRIPRLNMVRYATAALMPAQPERVLDEPSLAFGVGAGGAGAILVAGLALLLLAAGARSRSGKVPPVAWIAGGLFVLLAAPSLVRFDAPSFFLPGAAAALGLAALLRALGKRAGLVAGTLLAFVWSAAAVDHWIGWREAARASAALTGDLVAASRAPGVDRLVVANLPRRVRGIQVGLEFTAAIEALGGRPVPVDYVTYLDYRRAGDDDLDRPPEEAVRRSPEGTTIDLLVPERHFSRNLDPGPGYPDDTVTVRHGTILFFEPNHMRLLIPPPGPGVAVYVWRRGRLEPLDTAATGPGP
jgi:hypothetical protein